MYVFECRAECRTHSSIFKVCIILNAELNVELTARYSRCMFSNAELNVEPIARYSRCVLFWMQSWTSISQLDILIFLVLLVEYRAEYRSHSSIFADYVCQYIAEYRLSIPLPTSQTYLYRAYCEAEVVENRGSLGKKNTLLFTSSSWLSMCARLEARTNSSERLSVLDHEATEACFFVIFSVLVYTPFTFNSLTTEKQTTNFSSANFQKKKK